MISRITGEIDDILSRSLVSKFLVDVGISFWIIFASQVEIGDA